MLACGIVIVNPQSLPLYKIICTFKVKNFISIFCTKMKYSYNPVDFLDLIGDFSFALARRFPEAAITGVDLTPAMLEIARAKNRSPHIRFMEGDALALPVEGPFELCACAFGFRNFPDRRQALREVRRVLAPGGELLVLEFFRPVHALLGRLTAIWLRVLAPLFALRRRSAYRYLRESMDGMVSADDFVRLAAEEGFALEGRRFFFPCCTCLRLRKEVKHDPPARS